MELIFTDVQIPLIWKNFEKSKNKPYSSSAMPLLEPIWPHGLKNSKYCLWTNLLSTLALNHAQFSLQKITPLLQ
jgi:hypothetical protein